MVSQITLGNFYQSGGKTVTSGSQSGIDTEGLINALTEARRQPAVKLEAKNESIDKQTAAYNQLKTILSSFKTSLDVLRNPPGVNNASQNIFEYRTATLSSNDASYNAANYVSMTVEPGAAAQNFTINEVKQLAVETKQESGTFTLPTTTGTASPVVTASGDHQAGKFAAGSFVLRGVDGQTNSTITLNEDDSLATVVSKFNEVKGRTGIQANILKVAGGDPDSTYKIIFTSTKTGEDYAFDMADAGTVISDPSGVLQTLNAGFNETQAAKNAVMTIDGVEIERQSNAINDLIEGITFTLKQATPPDPTDAMKLNASVVPDTTIVSNALTQFADAYNAFRLFVANQQARDENGVPTEDAVLATEQLLRTITNQVAAEVTRVVAGITDGNPERLADIGINFSDFAGDDTNPATKNIMTIDTDKLSSALAADFDGVRGLFEFNMTSDNANLGVFKRTNSLNVANFTLTIDRTNGIYKASYDDADGNPQEAFFDATPIGTSGGLSLVGRTGSDVAGLELIFATTGDATIEVNITQGMGDRLFSLMDSITNELDGTLTKNLETLAALQKRNATEITKIDDKIEAYREQLIQQYAALEGALSKANNLLSLLDAQASARESNS